MASTKFDYAVILSTDTFEKRKRTNFNTEKPTLRTLTSHKKRNIEKKSANVILPHLYIFPENIL